MQSRRRSISLVWKFLLVSILVRFLVTGSMRHMLGMTIQYFRPHIHLTTPGTAELGRAGGWSQTI
jgi:hypothetical protein